MMRQLALLLLILVSVSAFYRKHKGHPLKPYEKFQKFATAQVIETCSDMMKTKRLNKEGEKCKKINTFIRAPLEDVMDVCKNGEETKEKGEILHMSHEEFDITVCSVKEGGGMFPNCAYEGMSKKSKILIKCLNGSLPEHFHELWTVNDRYRNFINQHIKKGMSQTRCDQVMYNRHITENGNECKKTNTFIRATTKLVKSVCDPDGGEPYKGHPNLRVSLQPFSVVICERRSNKRYPRCKYRGKPDTRYIVIGCEEGFPVHFDGFSNN